MTRPKKEKCDKSWTCIIKDCLCEILVVGSVTLIAVNAIHGLANNRGEIVAASAVSGIIGLGLGIVIGKHRKDKV